MTNKFPVFDPFTFKTPSVRHLAWLCSAPQLLACPQSFYPGAHLDETANQLLLEWDRAPENGPSVLTQTPPRRLGHYFESLYGCMLESLLGWEILAKNLQIQQAGLTLGELDFLVRNPMSGLIEHHEIAVKFYLGVASKESPILWYGPNAKDRLDLKTHRLLNHQCSMSERPETLERLAALGLPAPHQSRVFMPGYLFSPGQASLPTPDTVPPDHLRGRWCYQSDLDASELSHWAVLNKPHWLGPWEQASAPDHDAVLAAMETVRDAGIPRLFAELKRVGESSLWREQQRCFVVPDIWPGI